MKRIFGLILIASLAFVGCAEPADAEKPDAEPSAQGLQLGSSGAADNPNDPYKGDLVFDIEYQNELRPNIPYHVWSLKIADDSPIFIDLNSRVGDDTTLLVYKREGNGFALSLHNDDCYSDTLNSCFSGILGEGGEYLIVATTYDFAYFGVPTAASYGLQVFCDAASGCDLGVVGQPCGSRGLEQCPSGYYCDWSTDDTLNACGATDHPGVCAAIPDTCFEAYEPVCGCDGRTYSNICYAAAAGVDVNTSGACEGTGSGLGETCGGIAALQCEDGLVCDMSQNQACFPDMAGICVYDEIVNCTLEYEPVCGCDGQTYGNDCQRRSAKVSLDHAGECASAP